MNILIEGFNKSIHKKDNQIVIKEKDIVLDSIKANQISSLVIIGKGYITFDYLGKGVIYSYCNLHELWSKEVE